MSQLENVMKRLDMDLRIVKLTGHEEYRIQIFRRGWFGLGKAKWRFIPNTTFSKVDYAQNWIDLVKRAELKEKKDSWERVN